MKVKIVITRKTPKGAFVRCGKEYTGFVPNKKLYGNVDIGDEREIDESAFVGETEALTEYEIKGEAGKTIIIEHEGKECNVPKSFVHIEEGKAYLTQYTIDNLKPRLSKEEYQEAFKKTYHEIEGSTLEEDGSVSVIVKVPHKELGTQESKENFSKDYCSGKKVLGNNINGATMGLLNDPELSWGENPKPFKVIVNYEGMNEYTEKKSSPEDWE